jgi:hypothetical protein
MSHTESDLGVLYMDGKIISRSFQWHRFQAQIQPESTGIVCITWHPESVPVLRRRLLVFWAVYRVRAHSGRIQGVLHDPRDFISSCHILVRVWVLLKLFSQEQFTDRPVCETPTRVLNQSSAIFQIVFFLVLVCVFDS